VTNVPNLSKYFKGPKYENFSSRLLQYQSISEWASSKRKEKKEFDAHIFIFVLSPIGKNRFEHMLSMRWRMLSILLMILSAG
jgi:hypothetical protein